MGDTPAVIIHSDDWAAGPQAHAIDTLIYTKNVFYGVATQKTISIRDDQAEWIDDNYLSLSQFVQDKLDEHIEQSE